VTDFLWINLVDMIYLGSIDQYEEQFLFILDLIKPGLPYD
jgi:hypothetical protein